MDNNRVITLGCRLNAQESEIIEHELNISGQTDKIVINSCAVTNEAVRQTRQAIRKAYKHNPDKQIIVTGCAAQIDPASFSTMAEVTAVVGNGEKLNAQNYPASAKSPRLTRDEVKVADINKITTIELHKSPTPKRCRAFIQIQNGCDHRCTFCIIPYGRGISRSLAPTAIIDEIKRLVDRGWHEVVLTGVNITSYGHDLPQPIKFGQLIKMILKAVPQLSRLRLSSIDPAEVDDDLLAAIADDERLMPHIHLSLQAGDDMILKRMKRRHSCQQALRLCHELHKIRPGIALGADMIAGFPTETEVMAANSADFITEAGLVYLHIFPFSPRQGTPAARMPQVNGVKVKQRAANLRQIGARQKANYLKSRIGSVCNVLLEKDNFGHCENFAPITIADFTTTNPTGLLIQGQIVAADDNGLRGKAIS